jgi:putative transposase
MGHSYINVLVHIVFSTKERRKIIPTDKQEELWKYMTGIARNLRVNTVAIGGMPDHIHMLIAESGTIPISTGFRRSRAVP